MMDNKPWWFPEKVDENYFARLREDYPENADWTDEELNNYYNEYGGDYVVLWDHLGDAYAEYKPLADSFFELLEACEEFVRKVECGEARSTRSYAQMKAAIEKIKENP